MAELADIIAELSATSVVVRDRSGRTVKWNTRAQELYGWSESEAVGRDLHSMLRSRHYFGIDALDQELQAVGAWAGDVYRTTKDGREICVSIAARRSNHDGVEVFVEVAHESMRTVGDGAHRYHNLFHAMAASFWELDFSNVRRMIGEMVAEGVHDLEAHFALHPEVIDRAIASTRLVDVNDATVTIFAAPSREAILAASLEWVWPADARHVYAAALVAATRRQYTFSTEVALARWDGTRVDILFTVCWPHDHQAKGTVLVGVIDISNLKHVQRDLQASEWRYSRLFHAMAAGYLELDFTDADAQLRQLRADGTDDLGEHLLQRPRTLRALLSAVRVLSLNEKAAEILRAGAPGRLRGTVSALVPAGGEAAFAELFSSRARQTPPRPFEVALEGADGSVVEVQFSASGNDEGSPGAPVLVSIVDIGGRKRTEASLRQAQSDYAHAARVATLGEMAASIAHEVNQPLAALSASGQAIRRWLDRPTPEYDEVATLADDIVSDARRASEIIARIRAMSLNRAPRTEELDMNAVVAESALIVRHELLDRGVVLLIDPAEHLPTIEGDRVQMQQVVVNLLINAVQAMAATPASDKQVRIRSGVTPTGLVEVEVADYGPGVRPHDRERLFNGFFSTKPDGMGIGLSICRTILEAHGGNIELVDSDRGAAFVFRLPALNPFGDSAPGDARQAV